MAKAGSSGRRVIRALVVLGTVVSLLAGACGASGDEESNVTAYCDAVARLAAQMQQSAGFDTSSASASETKDYFVHLRDGYAALRSAAPATVRSDLDTLWKTLDDLVRELDRRGYTYSELLADPDGRRVMEAMSSATVNDAASRVNRFGEENCSQPPGDAPATTAPSAASGLTGSVVSTGGTGSRPADPRVPLVACLRAQGLAVPDLPAAGAVGTPAPQYPPDAATRAWQSCRSIYAASISGGAQSDTMAFVDCMATQGWLQAVMSAAPADLAAHNAASARCRAQSPSVQAVVACLRTNGVDIVDPATVPGATPAPQRFEPSVASAAWKVCREVYRTASGMPAAVAASALRVPDCMAAQGWIVVIMTGEPGADQIYDKAAYDAARATCG